MKKLIDAWISQHTEDRIILKLDRQSASFKKTNLYKNISNIACVVEIYELKGQVLERWVLVSVRLIILSLIRTISKS